MKVAMVTPYWLPVRGGITTYVSELVRELRQSTAAEIMVVAREGARPGATILGGDARAFTRETVAELVRFGPDVVHAHGHWYTLAAGLRYRARHTGTRIVFTLHTELEPKGWLRTRTLSRLLSDADEVTAVSEDLLVRMKHRLRFRARTHVVRPGVSIRPVDSESSSEFLRTRGLSGKRPLIGFVGPLAHSRKVEGLKCLVRAMPILRNHYPAATLLVGGDGPLRNQVEQLAEREVPGGVQLLGSVDDPAPLFSSLDVYAHVSFQEGLPQAVLEAMACGIPIVATPVGGIPEALRDGATGVFTTGEPGDVADKIIRLLDNPEVAKGLAALAEEVARRDFAWSVAARRFLALYVGRVTEV